MKRMIVVWLLASTPLFAQSFVTVEIDNAIRLGQTQRLLLGSSCVAVSGPLNILADNGSFSLLALGPFGRIMQAAKTAKAKYLPFTPADVTEAMQASVLTVVATPHAPQFTGGSWHYTPNATHLVLKSKPPKDEAPIVLQPTTIELIPHHWSSARGGQFDGQGVMASFDLAAFKAIPHKEVDMVVITDSGERRCKIGEADKKGIR